MAEIEAAAAVLTVGGLFSCIGGIELGLQWAPRLIPRPPRFSNRRPRLKGLGNAVVPQCAFVVALALIDWMADLADLAE